MRSRTTLILTATACALLLSGCKKPPEPPPAVPDPKTESPAEGPGTTTNFENTQPAPPAGQ